MDPATDEDNHDSTDSTSFPATNDVKSEKQPSNNDKSNRLRAKPDIPVMFSDSEDSLDGFGYYTKKRKKDSESEDDWDPRKGKAASPKKKLKTEKSPKKQRKPREPKTKAKREPKPKKEKGEKKPRKPRGKKTKEEVKEENSNDASDEPSNEPEPTEKDTEEEADGEADGDNDTAEESNPASAEYSVPKPAWEKSDLLSELIQVDRRIAENIIRLFENENTIPFIARYRRELTGDMSPEDLRKAKDAFETIKSIQMKAASILKAINKIGKLTPHLEQCIVGSKSIVELEHLYAPYKTGGKKTKADTARQLGLEPAAMTLLEGSDFVALEPLIREDIPGRETMWEVENNISYIIADVISKDKDVLDHLRTMLKNSTTTIRIESSLSRTAKSCAKGGTRGKRGGKTVPQNRGIEEGKYELYYKFSVPIRHVKPHQVLALNRGENQKILSVKVTVPDWFTNKMHDFCRNRWLRTGYEYPQRHSLFAKSFKDAFTRLIHPLLARQIRSSLNQEAERAAIEVFATNLKKLLLTPPLRGTAIMGIDPGFIKGCKVAVISSSGAVLETAVLNINNSHPNSFKPPHQDPTAEKLKELLLNNRCEMIGLGNGKGCRETEEYLSYLIQKGWFSPLDIQYTIVSEQGASIYSCSSEAIKEFPTMDRNLISADIQYTIVSEQGASIYSCSSEAIKEFPTMDRNLISAVSLARRVQDPLSEMVKVEPKHLGVGMYQHDVSEKQLNSTLDEVVSECVSFVGVHINTASLSVLRRVAGLNQARATKILEWREANGPFTNRQQLRLVKGIGEKTFEQCAGFVRIQPPISQDDKSKRQLLGMKQSTSVETEFNPLDQTWIHPESYNITYRFMRKCGVDIRDLGNPNFIAAVGRTISENGVDNLSRELGTSDVVLQLIAEGLQKPLDHDFRSELSKPLFRRGVTSLQDLTVGTVLTGRVQNVTHFGAFVDIGVGRDGLIHASKFHSNSPQLGDRVEVRVSNIEVERKRIQLELISML